MKAKILENRKHNQTDPHHNYNEHFNTVLQISIDYGQ